MKKKTIFIILIILATLSFLVYSYRSTNFNFNSPDETTLKYFGSHYSNTGNLYYPTNQTDIFQNSRIRGTYVLDNKIVPLKFIGFMLYMGGVSVIDNNLYSLLTGISAAVIILLIFLISKILYDDDRVSLFSSLILIFLPFFWYWANHAFFENISTIMFLLTGLLFFLKTIKTGKLPDYLITGIMWGVSAAFRYDILIFIVCFLVVYFKDIYKLNKRYLLLSLLLFLLFLSPVLISSKQIYGSYFLYGDKILSSNSGVEKNNSIANVFGYIKEVYLLIPLLFLSVLYFVNKANYLKDLRKKFILSVILYVVIFTIIFIYPNSVKQANILHDSLSRYLLTFFVLLSIFYSKMIFSLNNKYSKILLIFLTILLFISVTIPILEGQWNAQDNNGDLNSYIIQNTPNNSFILVDSADKFIFPNRNVIPIVIFSKDYTYENIDKIKLNNYLNELIKNNYPVYVFYTKSLDDYNITESLKSDFQLNIIDQKHNIYVLTKK